VTVSATPLCSWVGLDTDTGLRENACGRPASYFIEESSGHRVYSCLEHLSHAKALAPFGHEVHQVPVRNHNAPSPYAAVHFE
jgi:hypothetical protein